MVAATARRDETKIGRIVIRSGSDIHTWLSCQENRPGVIWIQFPSASAESFLTIIASNREEEEGNWESIYERMLGIYIEGDWEFDVVPHDLAEIYDEESDGYFYEGPSYILLNVSIRFPSSDYEEVLKRVRDRVIRKKTGTNDE